MTGSKTLPLSSASSVTQAMVLLPSDGTVRKNKNTRFDTCLCFTWAFEHGAHYLIFLIMCLHNTLVCLLCFFLLYLLTTYFIAEIGRSVTLVILKSHGSQYTLHSSSSNENWFWELFMCSKWCNQWMYLYVLSLTVTRIYKAETKLFLFNGWKNGGLDSFSYSLSHSQLRTYPTIQDFYLMTCWYYFPHSVLGSWDLSEISTILIFELIKIWGFQLLLTM